jgi:anti-sigma regulatory factor (Ser/Thr protein kinase)
MDANETRDEQADAASSRVQLPLTADIRAPREARTFVRTRWPELDEEVLDDVVLIVSELVSNAVQHGEPDIVLRMLVEPFSIDVSVLDHGAQVPPPTVQVPSDAATSGRGLSIVDRLASDWGVKPLESGDGKHVWARLRVGDE